MSRRAPRCSCASSPPGRGRTGRCRASTAAPLDEAVALLVDAGRRGLDPAGVSFHVGLAAARPPRVGAAGPLGGPGLPALRSAGHHPWLLDLGGGFPASLDARRPLRSPTTAGSSTPSSPRSFGADRPRTLVEPGRGIVGDAGTVVASVVGVVDRGGSRWVFLDAGVFTGLVETLDEAIRYRLETPGVHGPTGPCVLAGPDLRQRRRALRDDAGRPAARAGGGRRGASPRGRGVLDVLLDRGLQRLRAAAHRHHPLTDAAPPVTRGRGRCRRRPCCRRGRRAP